MFDHVADGVLRIHNSLSGLIRRTCDYSEIHDELGSNMRFDSTINMSVTNIGDQQPKVLGRTMFNEQNVIQVLKGVV